MVTRINIGPVHPSTHGVLRLVADVDGDTVVNLEPHIGFLHRGVEKLVETRMYMQNPPYMEKLDYIAPMSYDDAYVATVEKAMGVEVKERAMWVRTVLLELQRIASHLLWLGTMANDVGQFFTVFMWAFTDRDMVMRLLEEASGARMFYVNMRIGGLIRDLPPGFGEKAGEVLAYIEKRIKKYENFLEKDPLFTERMKGIGVLSRERAIELGVTGPVLRGSGVGYDVRKNNAYYVYDKLNFRPQTRSDGDCFARYKVRMLEMAESIRLVREALAKMPEGDALGMPIKLILPSAKNRMVSLSRETPRGECLMYMVADSQKPYRLSIRAPTFINLAAMPEISRGCRTADIFAISGSLDLVMGDVDR
ncbi:MAG: NADH-quinone oxidoreductase subunit D [Candidatus Micrarchaeota archaeon]|nr:NADH-quinone oxidoreductase subunit D [Candidatus Micrarchaeota archaeon]